MSRTAPLFSFCIVSFNSRAYLQACLASLVEFPPTGGYEIIVVDNHSKDGSAEMIAKDYPQVRLVPLQTAASYTSAMNRALKQASGRYLVQLNPDTLVRAGVWDAMVRHLESHPEVGICTPKVRNQDGSLQKQCRRSEAGPWDTFCYVIGLARVFPRSRFFAGYLMTYKDEDEIHACDAVSGACMIVRKEVVQAIGYLDEIFYAYQEDSDYCFRARRAGFQIHYVPTADITHYGGQGGSLTDVRKSIVEWHRSYWIYYRRYFAHSHFFLVNWLVYAGILVRLLIRIVANLIRRQTYIGSKKP